jgi:hypothetical protein
MHKFKLLLNSQILVLTLIVIGCNRDEESTEPKVKTVKDYSADVTFAWNKHYFYLTKINSGYRPPISARALAYIGLAVYESVAPGMKEHQSIANNFPTLVLPKTQSTSTYHWGVAANAAYLFSIKIFIQKMNEQDYKKTDSLANSFYSKFMTECDSSTFNRSKKFGEQVAQSVYTYSIEDGQTNAFRNNKPTDYFPPSGPDKWRSTPPDYLGALTPRWGNVRTFFLKSEDRQLKDPIQFSTDKNSEFYKQVKEVYDAVKNTTTESKWVAEFWSDDLHTYTIDAGGRWIAIADAFMKENKVDLETAIYIDTKLGLTLHDAAVLCWHAKYTYNLLRPVSFINENIDINWRPILRDPTKPTGQQIGVTPQHPSYPSGHSVFGQAAVEILINTFGDKINFTDRTHEKETYFDGRPRTFTSFTQMSEENAYSRIPLGVHYRMDCVEGLRLGKIVGQRINAVNWKKAI